MSFHLWHEVDVCNLNQYYEKGFIPEIDFVVAIQSMQRLKVIYPQINLFQKYLILNHFIVVLTFIQK